MAGEEEKTTLTQSLFVRARLKTGVAQVSHLTQSGLHRIINKSRALSGGSQSSMNKEPCEGTGKGWVSKGQQTASFTYVEDEDVNFTWDTLPPLFSIGLYWYYWKRDSSLVLSDSCPHPGRRCHSLLDHCHYPMYSKASLLASCSHPKPCYPSLDNLFSQNPSSPAKTCVCWGRGEGMRRFWLHEPLQHQQHQGLWENKDHLCIKSSNDFK